MRWLDRVERRLRRYAVPHVTMFLVFCQVIAYGAGYAQPEVLNNLTLVPQKVQAGEVWRVATFLAVPPLDNPIFAFFYWYLFWLMGSALEQHWGAFRYNLFLLLGWLATVAGAMGMGMFDPESAASNGFLQGSVFLAFAFLYPDFLIHLFFILPVKIKWLAILAWIGYFLAFVFGTWVARVAVLSSVANFLVFFSGDIVRRIGYGRRHMAAQAQKFAARDKPFHVCTVCGITDRTHPDMDFRYCTRCSGTRGYCTQHIHDHEHITAGQDAAQKK